MKLNQVIAIANGEKSRKQKVFSQMYQMLGQPALFDGIAKTYEPKDEEGDIFPREDKNVQMTVERAIEESVQVLKDMYNIIATNDIGNCDAKADVKVNNTVVLKDVPVTHLIFLEKQLEDIATFITAFPVLDPAEEWEFSDDNNCWKSEPRKTTKTKKVPKNHVLAEATSNHPAQVQVFTEDVVIGYWTTIKMSGCYQAKKKVELIEKVRSLSKAVKMAREEANSVEIAKSDFGNKVLDFIFGDQ